MCRPLWVIRYRDRTVYGSGLAPTLSPPVADAREQCRRDLSAIHRHAGGAGDRTREDRANHVCVIPPNGELTMVDGALDIFPTERTPGPQIVILRRELS